MSTTDTTPFLALDQVQDNWNFLEVWIDPLQSPPYILLLLSDEAGHCSILDPAESYRVIKQCSHYKEAELWLLEDEYEPLEGRLMGAEIA